MKIFTFKIGSLVDKWIKSGYFFIHLSILLSLCVFIIISLNVVIGGKITFYDQIIVTFLNNFASLHSVRFIVFITKLGSEYIIFLLLPIFLIFLFFNYIKEALLLLLSTYGSYLFNTITKDIFDRIRPVVEFPIFYTEGYSFPSGHAMISVCFYGVLIYLSLVYIKNKWLKTSICLLFSLLILLIGITRVYLGIHYPSDIIGGYSLGIFWLSLCILIYKKLFKYIRVS